MASVWHCGCPKDFRGIGDGDTIQTTVVSNVTAETLFGSTQPSCGDLGDLPASAVFTSVASVVADKNGGQSCFMILTIKPRTLTTGTFESTVSGTTVLKMQNGCTGQFDAYFQSSSEASSLLDNGAGSRDPSWRLIRRFQTTGDASLCFPGGTPAPATCVDAFVGQNIRK